MRLFRLGAFSSAIGIALLTSSALGSPQARGDSLPTTSIGARLGPISAALAERLGLAPRQGAVVTSVTRQGLAARAGLHVGDVILGAGDRASLSGPGEVQRVLESQPRGTPLELKLLRQGKPLDLSLVLPRAATSKPGQKREAVPALSVPRIGASVADTKRGGALVRTVEQGLVSSLLRPGDLILNVNDHRVRTAEDVSHIAEEAPEGAPLMLRIRRHGQVRLIGLRLAEPSEGQPLPSAGDDSPSSEAERGNAGSS